MAPDLGRWLTTVLRRPVKLPPREYAAPADAPLRAWLLVAAVLCVTLAIGAVALLRAAKPKSKRLPRPPGLAGLLASLVLGIDLSVYLFRFGPTKADEFFDECCATLGRFFTLRLGPNTLVVTTDTVACHDLFVGKKKSFSTQTVPVMVINWFFKDALPALPADQWPHDRAVVQGAIAGHSIHLAYPAMHAKLGTIRDRIDESQGNEFDLSELLPVFSWTSSVSLRLASTLTRCRGRTKTFFTQ
jgi:hypothetical protein